MSEYAKNIQTIEDLWKKRIELPREGGWRMSEYITDERGEVHGEIVRCRDCMHYRFVDRSDIFHDERHNDRFCLRFVDGKRMEVEPEGFCAWGERKNDE